jgi:uncharacterized protein
MQLVNEFTVPADADAAFAILSDLERIAGCLPGAVLEERDGDEYRGRVGVRIGPVNLVMASTGTVLERDPQERRFVVRGSAREKSGQGGAQAVITMTVGDQSETGPSDTPSANVRVVTDLSLSGRVAQFGGAAITQVNRRIVDQFVKRLDALIRAEQQLGQPATAGPAAPSVRATDAAPSRDAVLARWGTLAPVAATVVAGAMLGLAIARAIRSAGAAQHRL